jgi:Putative transposase DNA-binding domain
MFGRKSKGFVQMYEYGCRNEPIAGLDAALDQMERRVQPWNRFVEIERETLRRVRSLVFDETEQREICETRTRIASLRALIQERRRTEPPDFAGMEDLRKQVLASRKVLVALIKRAKLNEKERYAHCGDALKALQEERAREVKQAQKDSKLYWCNYDDVWHAYELARVRVRREGVELREHQWNGSGRVSVRFQRGLPVPTAFTRRGLRLQIDPVREEAWTSPVRSTRRTLSRTIVRIRVASTLSEQLPVWFVIPVVIHRPLPSDGVIRSAALLREHLGLSWRYRLIVTVAGAGPPASAFADRPSLGIDLGWRVTPEGLRVASWADTLDCHGQGLLQLRDAWQERRIGGDYEIFEQLLEWRKRHVHLWTWAVNLRDQLTRKRLELFHNFAAVIVKRYGTIFVERFDLRWFARTAPPEIRRFPIGGKYRVLAAPGVLRQVIENACRRTGVRLERVKAWNTTKTCHACGRIEEWNVAKQVVHTCTCGATWD